MNKMYQNIGKIYEENKEEIQKSIECVIKMCLLGKREGLLALEWFVEENAFPEPAFLQKAVLYLVDGKESKLIDKFLTNRILTETDEKKQLIRTLYKESVLLMQEDQYYLYHVQEYITSLFSQDCEEEVGAYIKEVIEADEKQQELEQQEQLPQAFAKAYMQLPEQEETELAEFELEVLMNKTDFQIQTWLREMDYFHVNSLLLAGSKEFRERILVNMSSRLQMMVMEDIVKTAGELSYHWYYEEELKKVREALERGKVVLREV